MSKYPARVRVLIADDHPLSHEQIKAIVAPHYEVVGTVLDSRALPQAALRTKPDAILINSALAMDSRFEIIADVLRRLPSARIILYSDDPAKAPVEETSVDSNQGSVIACGVSDGTYFPSTPVRSLQMSKAVSSKAVTSRECEVLALLAAGYPMKQIAFRLGITYRTVTFHKYRIMERLGITTNAGLVAYALKQNIFENIIQAENAAAA